MAFSKLLGQDAGNVSPKTARKHFDDEVQRLIEQDGSGKPENFGDDFSTAWNKAKDMHPECFDRMLCKTEPEIQQDMEQSMPLPNALGGLKAPRTGKALILPALGLPTDATDAEYDVAWTSNGGQHQERKSDAILTGLIAHLMSKNNWSVDQAKREAATRYPELWKAAGDKPTPARQF